MRRQQFAYAMPPQDDTSFFPDSDNMSVFSSLYSYPETLSHQVISPEPDALIPYYVYPYPFFEIPAEPISYIPGVFEPLLFSDTTFITSDYFYPQNDDTISSIVNTDSFCNLLQEDEIVTEDLLIDEPVNENFNNIHHKDLKTLPSVTDYGSITVLLRHLIRVDISPASAVYVTNSPASCIAVVNGSGDKSCVIHPNGRVQHIGHDIHMVTLDRQAKICRRGVVFTSTERCLSYLVDDSGTKTTSEKLRNLNHDFSLKVFYSNNMKDKNIEECYKMVNEAKYKSYKSGDEVWIIGDLRIKQDLRGDVKITRNGDRYTIQTSPTTGEVSVKTFSAEISIGRYADNYFSVRKEDKRVTASLKRFHVQNGGQKAGFNKSGKVVLF